MTASEECPHGMVSAYCARCQGHLETSGPRRALKRPPRGQGTRGVVTPFTDDDGGFRRWLTEHPAGWYINTDRIPKPEYVMLHRVGCMHVGDADPGMAWTESFIKHCSDDPYALVEWAEDTVGTEPHGCQTCDPYAGL